MITPDYCQLMANYNGWMNERLYAVCSNFSDADRRRDRGAFFSSIHGTLNHLLWGDRMWLGRFTGVPFAFPAFGADMFGSFDDLRRERVITDQAIVTWAASVRAEWLASTLEYESRVDSKTRRLSAAIAVVHLFNHETHHRGQLTTLISQAGVDPGVTDLPWIPGAVEIVA